VNSVKRFVFLLAVALAVALVGCAGNSNFTQNGKDTFGYKKSAFGPGPIELSLSKLNLSRALKLEYEAKIDSAIAAHVTDGNAAQIAFYQALRNAAGFGCFYTPFLSQAHVLRDEHLSHMRLHELGFCKCTQY